MAFAFSEQNWGLATRKLTERVKKRSVAEIAIIIDEARNAPLTFGIKNESAASAAVSETDVYDDICKFYHATMHPLIIVVSTLQDCLVVRVSPALPQRRPLLSFVVPIPRVACRIPTGHWHPDTPQVGHTVPLFLYARVVFSSIPPC